MFPHGSASRPRLSPSSHILGWIAAVESADPGLLRWLCGCALNFLHISGHRVPVVSLDFLGLWSHIIREFDFFYGGSALFGLLVYLVRQLPTRTSIHVDELYAEHALWHAVRGTYIVVDSYGFRVFDFFRLYVSFESTIRTILISYECYNPP